MVELPPAPDFVDVDSGGVHAAGIESLLDAGVTAGCSTSPPRFCPDGLVTRGQMATFLARALRLEASGPRAGFADLDSGGVHAAGIEALLAAGVTSGCSTSPPRFCPNGAVTRAQMATFLARALRLEAPSQRAGFADLDADGVHAAGIEALLEAGVTAGCSTSPLRFCPDGLVTRAQMATFLTRALKHLNRSTS